MISCSPVRARHPPRVLTQQLIIFHGPPATGHRQAAPLAITAKPIHPRRGQVRHLVMVERRIEGASLGVGGPPGPRAVAASWAPTTR
jgi:hypothetical protein